MLNINEEDLKTAIVAKAADQILRHDDDLSGLVRAEVELFRVKSLQDQGKVEKPY